jgi:hypothetical protein
MDNMVTRLVPEIPSQNPGNVYKRWIDPRTEALILQRVDPHEIYLGPLRANAQSERVDWTRELLADFEGEIEKPKEPGLFD